MGAVAIFVYCFLRAVCIDYIFYIFVSEITFIYSKWKYKLIEREWKSLEALLQDFDDVSRCANQITKEASQPLDSKLIQAGITIRLDERAKGWMSEARQVVSEAKGCVRSYHKLTERRDSSMCFFLVWIDLVPLVGVAFQLKRLNKFFGKKEICASDIYRSLEKSRSRIRSLQDSSVVDGQIEGESVKSRPLTDELISSLKEITGNRDWMSGMEEQLELIMIHLKLLHAFMKDLQPLELESKMEINWLTKTKEIIDKAKQIIDDKKTNQNFLQKWRAVRKFKEEMKSVGASISDLMEMKERYGFEFIRRDSLNSTHGRSPQQQTLLHQTVDDLDLLTQPTKTNDGSKTSATELSEQLKGMHELLKDRKTLYASNFRSSCLAKLEEMATDIKDYSKIFIEDSRSELASALTRIKDVVWLLYRCIKVYSIEARADSCSVGLEEDISQLVLRLTDNSKHRSIISIVGMKGIGKTTLAKKVYNHSTIKRHFEVRHWVLVPQNYDQDTLLTSVGNQILGTKGSRSGKYWIKEVYDLLNKEKRYLVVLDMVSSNEAMCALKTAFPKLTNGSKIVLTTCKRAIASNADQYSIPHRLRLRTKEESWEIFTQMMDNLGNMETLVKEVVERSSGGLPLVIIRLAYLLWETEVTPEKLRELEDINRAQNMMQWQFNLVMNYRELQFHPTLIKCFSYFQLFTSDFEIRVRRIAALWIAQGLLVSPEDNKTPEDIASENLLELIGRNLIQVVQRKPNGSVKTCCLPTTMRDLLLQGQRNRTKTQSWSFAESFKDQLSFHFADNDASFHHIDGLSTSSPNVTQNKRYHKSILFFNNKPGNAPTEGIHDFLRKGISDGSFAQLQLLDLERVLKPQLPQNIGKLKQLAYLGLRYTDLQIIPASVGDLVNLQTLDLMHTGVQKLPGSVWKSKKLQHLYLNEKCQLPKPTGISLTNLQILSHVFVDKGSPLKDGLSKLNNLRKLRLSFQLEEEEQKVLVTSIMQLTGLQSLKLTSTNRHCWVRPVLKLEGISALTKLTSLHLCGKLAEQSIINELPQGLTHLTLSASGIGVDQMQKLGQLQKLKSLSLCSGSYPEASMGFLTEGFPALLVLKLSELDNLKKLDVQEGAMRELRKLEIISCKNLAIITGFMHLRTLQKFQVN